MIDFKNASFMKLRRNDNPKFLEAVSRLLVDNEKIDCCFQGVRDGVVFTNLRMIAVNVQGVTGKKVDYSSLPYNKLQAFSVETAGAFDLDSELELWFSGLGLVKLEFTSGTDIYEIGRLIGKQMF